ncbi:hypothetical protein MTR_3g010640 [Medicago truncatula]|uniref:Retrotransposon gag domain-containing protein n=1 Tax=Medicago truncatula TaxID=3880 RepID=G7IVG5_MEDTR|nr:hypothetical protein MTR_3g010640 [Medicago truncatula]
MKIELLQILYVNLFASLDFHHITKFFEFSGTLGVSEEEEEVVFTRLFPHSLIGKAKEWYLDQPTQVMTNWNTLE